MPGIGAAPRPSQVDAYLPLIRETLEKFPTLSAGRLPAMAQSAVLERQLACTQRSLALPTTPASSGAPLAVARGREKGRVGRAIG